MAMDLPTLELTSARAWRSWLTKHHATSRGVWLVFQKRHTGEPSIPYLAALDEALCFGWIDSLVKRLDDDWYARKFTPRNATSKRSDTNRWRWADLEATGQLAPAGLAAAPTGKSYAPAASRPDAACVHCQGPRDQRHGLGFLPVAPPDRAPSLGRVDP